MIRQTVKVYPYATFDKEGGFCGLHLQTWAPYGDEGKDGGSVSKDTGAVYVYLPPIEVEVTAPELGVLEEFAVRILRMSKEKLRAEHNAVLARHTFTENSLLKLGHSEVLDREEKPVRPAYFSAPPQEDDDIQF